jgi:hypothetical protein
MDFDPRDYYDDRDTSDTRDKDERHRDDDDDALTGVRASVGLRLTPQRTPKSAAA